MPWRNNAVIQDSLELCNAFVQAERDLPAPMLRTKAARRLVELVSEPDLVRRRCNSAAFSLLAAGIMPTAGDIAWLVRDRQIGFPAEPTFEI